MPGQALMMPCGAGAARHCFGANDWITAVGAFADENGSAWLRAPLANSRPGGFPAQASPSTRLRCTGADRELHIGPQLSLSADSALQSSHAERTPATLAMK